MSSPVTKDVKIAALQNKLETYQKIAIDMQDRYHEQLEISKKLMECVEFYATTSSWGTSRDEECTWGTEIYKGDGGKKARQVLKELND